MAFDNLSAQLYSNWPLIKEWSWIIVVLLFGIVILYLYRQKKDYPLLAIIREKRGDDFIIYFDKIGKKTDSDNFTYYRFKSAKKETIPGVLFDYIAKCDKSKGAVVLNKFGTNQYQPIDLRRTEETLCESHLLVCQRVIEGDKTKFFCAQCAGEPQKYINYPPKLIKTDILNWKVLELKRTIERRKINQDFIQKWGVVIGLGIVAMIIIITMYMSYGMIQDIAAKVTSVAQGGNPQAAAIPSAPPQQGISLLNPKS